MPPFDPDWYELTGTILGMVVAAFLLYYLAPILGLLLLWGCGIALGVAVIRWLLSVWRGS